nr:uncharacterized protein LOC129438633 [Misgurnus anguillicaudatus]
MIHYQAVDENLPGPDKMIHYQAVDENLPGPDKMIHYQGVDENLPGPDKMIHYQGVDENLPRPDKMITVLAKLIQYFDENVQPKTKLDVQYSIAILLSKEQCTDENFSIETVLSRANAEKVKKTITDGQIFTELPNVIAARPDPQNSKNHSEYRLLYNNNNSFPDSPMDKLLKNAKENSCVIFYTYNSPCVKKCINGKKNILEGLSNWKNKHECGINVFVYRKVWHKDINKNFSKEFKKIDEKVPLYFCHDNKIFKWNDNKNMKLPV